MKLDELVFMSTFFFLLIRHPRETFYYKNIFLQLGIFQKLSRLFQQKFASGLTRAAKFLIIHYADKPLSFHQLVCRGTFSLPPVWGTMPRAARVSIPLALLPTGKSDS